MIETMVEITTCPICGREVHRQKFNSEPLQFGRNWNDPYGVIPDGGDEIATLRATLNETAIEKHLARKHRFRWLVYQLTGKLPRPNPRLIMRSS